MAAARRPPPVYAVNYYLLVGNGRDVKGGEGWAYPNMRVGNGNLTGKAGEGWTEIEIARREAYGFGDNMRKALNGLSLCVRLGDDSLVTSALGLRLSRDAHMRFNSELEFGADKEEAMVATANIMMQEQGLLIVVLLLERHLHNLSCYLVYDRSDASLSMVSLLPESLEVIGRFRPVPKRTSHGAFELFLFACECDDDDTDPSPFLCVFSPVTGTNRTCAWETKRTLRWNVPLSVFEMFSTDAALSFQGKGFWADLSQGLIYCDLPTASDDSAVDFGFIELPGECRLDLEEMLDCDVPMKTRTIACVWNSIWFVCIRRCQDPADDLVTMWTLELPGGQWKNWARFAVRELWRFDGFEEALLPKAKVWCPVLMADGALCLVVAGGKVSTHSSLVDVDVDHICTFDVGNKTLLWHGSVHDHIFTEAVAFPPDFFVQRKHGSHKRKFYNLRSAARPGFSVILNH